MKTEPKNWPPVHGRYTVGDPQSCVAVCTLKELDVVVPVGKVAITGPCMTENIGIERMIKNIISNRNIRYLILCGLEPKGHFVGQALKCLKGKGLGENRRIADAIGAMPFLKNVTDSEIECFTKQIELIDMIDTIDKDEIEKKIEECIKNDPGMFADGSFTSRKIYDINADYDPEKEFSADAGPDENWFVISVDHNKKKIIVEHYTGYEGDLKLCCRVLGDSAASIAGTIVKRKKISGLYNAAYLGKELQKAEDALRSGREYVQEDGINI